MQQNVVTHYFLGDDLTFLSRKFIRGILETSSLKHRFVVVTSEASFADWVAFMREQGVHGNDYMLLKSGRRSAWRGVRDLLRISFFSSKKVLSHRRHYNILLPIALILLGKRISFMCWGDIPARKRGWRRIYQLLQFSLYKVGIVQVSSEIPIFRRECYSRLKMLTMPYLRDNEKVLRLNNEEYANGQKILLLGNNAWYVNLYGSVLEGLDWNQWSKVICMLNYGPEELKNDIDAFCGYYGTKYGEKISFWRSFVPIDEYLKTIRACSTYIFPAETQGGIDLTYNMLLLGKKVICRGVNYAWLKEIGCNVQCLDDVNLCEVGKDDKLTSEEVAVNQNIVCSVTDKSDQNIKKWDEIFTHNL